MNMLCNKISQLLCDQNYFSTFCGSLNVLQIKLMSNMKITTCALVGIFTLCFAKPAEGKSKYNHYKTLIIRVTLLI